MDYKIKLNYGPPELDKAASAKPRIAFDGCPLCGSQSTAPLRSADCSRHPLYNPIVAPVMNWKHCGQCEHVFTDGYFTPDVADVIFAKTHENQKPGWAFEQQRAVSARMVECVTRYASGGAWLDVGFGNGSLLFTAEEWGFKAVGIDLRRSSVEAMQQFGFEAHCVDMTALDQPGRFSVISMADVLEHMPFPQNALTAAHQLLNPEGILFVSMPNYNCSAWQLLDSLNANPYWGELEHFHNFSRTRLYALLKDSGFEPVHYGISERYRVCMEVIAQRT